MHTHTSKAVMHKAERPAPAFEKGVLAAEDFVPELLVHVQNARAKPYSKVGCVKRTNAS